MRCLGRSPRDGTPGPTPAVRGPSSPVPGDARLPVTLIFGRNTSRRLALSGVLREENSFLSRLSHESRFPLPSVKIGPGDVLCFRFLSRVLSSSRPQCLRGLRSPRHPPPKIPRASLPVPTLPVPCGPRPARCCSVSPCPHVPDLKSPPDCVPPSPEPRDTAVPPPRPLVGSPGDRGVRLVASRTTVRSGVQRSGMTSGGTQGRRERGRDRA